MVHGHGSGQHAAPRAGGYGSGQHFAGGAVGGVGSGGYGVAPRRDDRTPLLIAIGVAAALLVMLLIVAATRGGGSEGGYTDGVRQQFVDRCASNVPRSTCECYIDEIAANVPFDEFEAYADALRQDPESEPPDSIQSAFDTCDEQA